MSGLYQTVAIGTITPPNRVTVSFQAIYNISFRDINLIETLLMFLLESLHFDKLNVGSVSGVFGLQCKFEHTLEICFLHGKKNTFGTNAKHLSQFP